MLALSFPQGLIPLGYLSDTVGGTTTIKVNSETRDALQALKGRRSYDEILSMLLKLVPEGDDEGPFKPEFRLSLLEGLLYDGPRISHDDMRREFGLK